jgi:hypothetical protein
MIYLLLHRVPRAQSRMEAAIRRRGLKLGGRM